MLDRMVKYMGDHMKQIGKISDDALRKQETRDWCMIKGDCVPAVSAMKKETVDYSIYSPPFASLYTYSASDRDMGNCRTHAEFYEHYRFLVKEMLRVTKPGRLSSVHCMNLPTSKARDGYIGISDFRGEIVRIHVEAGWIFHSEVCIWKDPVTAMQRTKALGLLHKQIVKDSCMSRQGIPDYLVTFRKPGENKERVAGELDLWIGDEEVAIEKLKAFGPTRFSIELWQRYASPVWTDIRAGRTLQRESAREHLDERHVCPLQLDVIERGIELWSNEGDLILSPFAGIGSEGFVAVQRKRRFVGVELKGSYWKQAVANLRIAEQRMTTKLLK